MPIEDRLVARAIALKCTQGMLMALDRDHRLAYVLDVVFGLTSAEAAAVLEISPAAQRQRLSRARTRLHAYMGRSCSLVNTSAACRCDRQVPAYRAQRRATGHAQRPRAPLQALDVADVRYEQLLTMFNAAAVFRAHPQYAVPSALQMAIRTCCASMGGSTTLTLQCAIVRDAAHSVKRGLDCMRHRREIASRRHAVSTHGTATARRRQRDHRAWRLRASSGGPSACAVVRRTLGAHTEQFATARRGCGHP